MGTPVRLSPIELRNLSLINDPSLEGYSCAGRVEGSPGDTDGEAVAVQRAAASSVEEEEGVLGRVEAQRILVDADIRRIEARPYGPIAHEAVEISPDNPNFITDGRAIYSKDGTVLISLIVACKDYTVLESCVHIGDRAFDSAEELESIKLPEGLESIGRLAFAKSGLRMIAVPSSVRTIEEKAFYGCRLLLAALVPEGVEAIGEQAFALSGIERLHLPSTIRALGHGICERTPVQQKATQGTFSISQANEHYSIDRKGGLYYQDTFFELVSLVPDYSIALGCVRIGADACRHNTHIRSVTVSEGILSIGENAFRGCRSLNAVALPESLEVIGDRAFMNTSIREMHLGPNVVSIGESALLVQGENALLMARPMTALDLDPRNESFYMESGILCERGAGDGGADKAVVYAGSCIIVTIPDAVNRIAPFAFFGASGIEELRMHDHMHSICAGSLSVRVSIPLVKVALGGEEDAGHVIELPVPSFSSRYRTYTDLFTTDSGGTVFVFPYYDSWVTNTTALEEFAPCALARLRDPVHLLDEIAEIYLGILKRKALAVCSFFADAGDLSALEFLHDLGVIDADVVAQAIAQNVEDSDACTLGCLLEMQKRLGGSRIDLRL